MWPRLKEARDKEVTELDEARKKKVRDAVQADEKAAKDAEEEELGKVHRMHIDVPSVSKQLLKWWITSILRETILLRNLFNISFTGHPRTVCRITFRGMSAPYRQGLDECT